MRPLPAKFAAEAAKSSVYPVLLVEIRAGKTIRVATRPVSLPYAHQGVEWNGNTLRLFNQNGMYSSLFLGARVDFAVNIYLGFGEDITSNEYVHVYHGATSSCEVGAWITCQLKPAGYPLVPTEVAKRGLFNHLLPKGVKILTPGGTTSPPTAQPPKPIDGLTIPPWQQIPVPPSGAINAGPTLEQIQRNALATGDIIPPVYGDFQIGGRPFAAAYNTGTNTWTVGYMIGRGPLTSIDAVWINGAAPVVGVTVEKHVGENAQTPSALLSAAIGSEYQDALILPGSLIPGDPIAYVVIQYTNTHYPSWPDVVIEGKGIDYSGTGDYANPIWCLKHFILKVMQESVDDGSFAAAIVANATAGLNGGLRRSGFGQIDAARPPHEWLEILRAYAGVWLWKRGSVWHCKYDKRSTVISTITGLPADIYDRRLFERDFVQGTFRVYRIDQRSAPNVVSVSYSYTGTDVWREEYRESKSSEASAGSEVARTSFVRMPGITDYVYAALEANERRKKLALARSFVGEVLYQNCDLEPGDVVRITHWVLGTDVWFRINETEWTGIGRLRISGTEYSASVYDHIAESDFTFPSGTIGGTIGETS